MSHRHPLYRRHRLASYAAVILAGVAFYVVPIAVMALCIHLGWYAEVPA